jgi:glyoxylase-like metal-dependent hydrolase (beta-lactamase superfamily II)
MIRFRASLALATMFTAFAAVTVQLAVGTPARAQSRPAGMVPKGYTVTEVRDRLYFLSDGAYNTMFLVSDAGVIAVDPLPTLGARYLQAVAEVTDKPITHVVYSHEHADHIGAASLVPAGAQIIAQRETAALLAQRKDPRRPLPTVVFDETYHLVVGDQVLDLRYTGPNHMDGNVLLYAPRQKVLMLVDVVYPGYMPYPSLGVATDVPGYLRIHDDALSYDFIDLVAGHVDRLGKRRDVELSRDFTRDLLQTTERLLAEKTFPAFLKDRAADLSKTTWFLHDDYETDRIDACTAKLMDRWSAMLQGAQRMLRSHCRAMVVALAIQVPPSPTSARP